MPQVSDLTTLQSVKLWCQNNGIDPGWGGINNDAQLGVYISAASNAIRAHLDRRNLLYRLVDELRDGTRTRSMMLREYPVSSVSSLTVGAMSVPARPALVGGSPVSSTFGTGALGYVLEPWDGYPPGAPQLLKLSGYDFSPGEFNVEVRYYAGYAVIGELQAVPSVAPYAIVPSQSWGRFSQDVRVTYQSGTALAAVAQGATPAVGQYVPPAPYPGTLSAPAQTPALYTFAAADAGTPVLLSYSAVPYDLDHATAKWVGEWWSYRNRIGEKSRAMPQGMGTASWDLSAMPEDVKLILQPYRRMVPA